MFPQLLFGILLIIGKASADHVEASEVSALFLEPPPDTIEEEPVVEETTEPRPIVGEEDEDREPLAETEKPPEEKPVEGTINPEETSTLVTMENTTQTTVGTTGIASNQTDEIPEDDERSNGVADISDRRAWFIPVTGGDAIPLAIIPPNPEDLVTEEPLLGSIEGAVNDNRNWNVPLTGDDVIPIAVIPPEPEGASASATVSEGNGKNSADMMTSSLLLSFLSIFLSLQAIFT